MTLEADIVAMVDNMDVVDLMEALNPPPLLPGFIISPQCPRCTERSPNALIGVSDDGVVWTCGGCRTGTGTIFELRRLVLENPKAVARIVRDLVGDPSQAA